MRRLEFAAMLLETVWTMVGLRSFRGSRGAGKGDIFRLFGFYFAGDRLAAPVFASLAGRGIVFRLLPEKLCLHRAAGR